MTVETNSHVIAENARSRVRTAGLSGNYWFPVERSDRLGRGAKQSVTFWKQDIAIFRDEQGVVHAVEDRCAHRQLKLSLGEVKGCNLVCDYHGWAFDGKGQCVHIPHEVKAKQRPDIRIRSYDTAEKYGLIWVFPGDPDKAKTTPLPTLKQLDGDDPLPFISIDFTWKTHHSMIAENVCDFYHEHLHRKYKPFSKPKLAEVLDKGDALEIHYNTSFMESLLIRLMADTQGTDFQRIKVFYDYPYQRSDIDGKYFHWLFMLPMDETTTRVFFFFAMGAIKLPLIQTELPRWMRRPVLELTKKYYVHPLLCEDGYILEEEMKSHQIHSQRPVFEFNPIVRKMQAITLRKWDEYVSSEAAREKKRADVSADKIAARAKMTT